ncbi:MAG: SH3 domain-containing protein [Lachnospiraceae bacterium]|nr:SH3 domain-containing protein [Lachnospiraceae bacterium]
MKNKRILMILAALAAVLFLSGRTPALADDAGVRYDYREVSYDVVVAAQDGSGYLYLRYGPGTYYDVICTIHDGTVLHISLTAQEYGRTTVWGQTEYQGRFGWISLTHTKEYHAPEPVPQSVDYDVAVDAKDGSGYLYLRSGPGMSYEILSEIRDGEKLHISEEMQDASGGFKWGKTEYQGRDGWISLKHTTDYGRYLAEHPEATTEAPTTEAPTTAAPTTPAPTTAAATTPAPTTAAPTTPAPTTVAPTTPAPTTAAPTTPAPTTPAPTTPAPTTAAPTTPAPTTAAPTTLAPTTAAPARPSATAAPATAAPDSEKNDGGTIQTKLVILIAAGSAVIGAAVAALIVILSKRKKQQ